MFSPKIITSLLSAIIEKAKKAPDRFCHNPEKDFTRHGKLEFQTLVKFIITMGGTVLSDELKTFFGLSLDVLPTKSAFVQQRKKLKNELFPHLFNHFNQIVPFLKKQDGFHWLGADGSDVNLPTNRKDTENYVQYKTKKGGYYQMHINALYDLLERRFLDIVIQPRPTFNEAAALCTMVDRCPLEKNTVFVADRGYPTWNLLAHILKKGMFFLIRTKSPESPGSMLKNLGLPLAEEYSKNISLGLTRSQKKTFRKHPEKYRILRKCRQFDYIAEDDKETIYTLCFRVVSLKLSDNHYEYLITNLPEDKFDINKIKYYYNLRWNIETSFRHLKYRGGLVYFHSANRSYIVQEIYARLIFYNCTSLFCAWADETKEKREKKWIYQVSFSDSVTVVRTAIRGAMEDEDILKLLCAYQVPIKKGRQAERRVESQSARPLAYRS